ncbi:MAG TPA: hypothetical protein VK824_08200, partial [Planctomycetota bacterium]|nr:hypothetical protein [Planctomycetota bacterium]
MSVKAFVVARTEYLKAVRSKAFIVGVLLMPILMGGSFIALAISEKAKDTQDRHFAVVDRSGGPLWDALVKAAAERNAYELYELAPDGSQGKQVRPRFVPERVDPPAAGEENKAELALSERVRHGEIFGYLILGRDLPEAAESAAGTDREFSWQTETPTFNQLPDWIENVVNATVRSHRLAGAG